MVDAGCNIRTATLDPSSWIGFPNANILTTMLFDLQLYYTLDFGNRLRKFADHVLAQFTSQFDTHL